MFAQANSEHCRHKIFNARLDHRRREAGQVAVRDDQEYAPVAAEGHDRRVQRQLVDHGRRRPCALLPRGAAQGNVYAASRRADAHPDEGRDAQPPDRDLAVPGRLHRRRRRNPRRRRDRPRRQAEGGPDRLHGVEPDAAGRVQPWENARDVDRSRSRSAIARQARHLRQAGPHRVAAADHDRRPDRRRRIQQRIRPAEPRRLFPHLRAERRRRACAAITSRS